MNFEEVDSIYLQKEREWTHWIRANRHPKFIIPWHNVVHAGCKAVVKRVNNQSTFAYGDCWWTTLLFQYKVSRVKLAVQIYRIMHVFRGESRTRSHVREVTHILAKTKAFTQIYGHKVCNHNAQTAREFASFTAKQRRHLSAKLRTCMSFWDVILRNVEICHTLYSGSPQSWDYSGLSPAALFHKASNILCRASLGPTQQAT